MPPDEQPVVSGAPDPGVGQPAPASGQPAPPAPAAPGTADSGAPPATGTETPATEDTPEGETKLLSPAAKSRLIAKEVQARKKLNEERAKLEQERVAAQQIQARAKELEENLSGFKADPLGWLEKNGVTYEELTKAVITRTSQNTTEAKLEKLIKEREEERRALEAQRAKIIEETAKQQQQAKVQAFIDAIHDFGVKNAAEYELYNNVDVEEAKGLIWEIADTAYQQWNRVPTPKETLDLLESHLLDQGLKYAKTKKVQTKLAPPEPPAPAKPAITNPAVKQLVERMDMEKKTAEATAKAPRTETRGLTNRMAASPMNGDGKPKKVSKSEAFKMAMQLYRDGVKD